jgi:hypothetical protein
LTTGELRPRLRRLVISVDPDAATTRQQQAVRDRRIECYPDPDGTATLLGTGLPAERARAAANRIDQLARAAEQSGDDRSMDRLRADTMLDLLDGTYAGREIDARIEVTVPLQTLLELKDAPGELAGYGPLVADIARQLADNSRRSHWRYTVIDGQAGRSSTAPPAAPRLRSPAQSGSGTAPAAHLAAACLPSGATSTTAGTGSTAVSPQWTTCAACVRRHHRLKHELGWRYRQIAPGVWAWTSPTTGRSYITPPEAIP